MSLDGSGFYSPLTPITPFRNQLLNLSLDEQNFVFPPLPSPIPSAVSTISAEDLDGELSRKRVKYLTHPEERAAAVAAQLGIEIYSANRFEQMIVNWVCEQDSRTENRQSAALLIIACKKERKTELNLSHIPLESLPIYLFTHHHFQENLEVLNLCETGLRELPPTIAGLRNLKKLFWSRCGVVEILGDLGSLDRLEELDLSHNNLTTIPPQFERLRNLQLLNLAHNRIEGDLDVLFTHRKLRELHLNHNTIFELPPVIQMPSLVYLDLSGNQLVTLPAAISHLGALRKLELYENPFEEFPRQIYDLPAHCEINIENIDPEESFLDIRMINGPAYRGPRFTYTFSEVPQIDSARSVNDFLFEIYHILGREQKDVSSLFRENPSFERALLSWLLRLSDTADSKKGDVYRRKIYEKAIDNLEFALVDMQFQKLFTQNIHDIIDSCADAVSLSILHLDVIRKLSITPSTATREIIKYLRTYIALARLSEVSENKVALERGKGNDNYDEIGAYLFFPVKLKEVLQLEIDVSEMRFARILDITKEEIAAAREYVLDAWRNPEIFVRCLIEDRFWKAALQAVQPHRMAEIIEEKERGQESATTDEEHAKVLATYEAKLSQFTLELLESEQIRTLV